MAMLSSSTTAITVVGTVTASDSLSVPTLVSTAFTSYILTTVTRVSTATVVVSGPSPTTYTTLNTLTSTSTRYDTVPSPTIPAEPTATPPVIVGGQGEVSG
ncbi:hypothetical protein GGI12_006299, partial [Dipsacomyces acuminosporus]